MPGQGLPPGRDMAIPLGRSAVGSGGLSGARAVADGEWERHEPELELQARKISGLSLSVSILPQYPCGQPRFVGRNIRRMAIYRLGSSDLEKLEETTLIGEGLNERYDLQRILKNCIDVIAPDSMIIAEEFCRWTNSQRRIDLLAIDSDANLAVIELKRTQDGGHMELQALRYASMVSSMTFKQAVEIYADYLGIDSLTQAEEGILTFLGWDSPSEEDFGIDVRIVLASGEFSMELTTSVLWLNEKGLDIKCIRMKPYRSREGILVNVEQVIPLPEAERFQVGIREKRLQQRQEKESNRDTAKRDLMINGTPFHSLPKRRIIYEVVSAAVKAGANIEEIRAGMPNGKWMVVDGDLNSKAFIEAAREEVARRGYKFAEKKYFTDDADLFHVGGKTYALSNQWGTSTQGHVEKIQLKWGLDLEIDW